MTKTLTGDIPREIAGYKVISQIGEGGMARVFKGKNDLGGVAAIKVISPYYKHDSGFKERFRREAEALTHVKHEGIVRILQWVDEDETLAMIMELLEGRPYNEHLDDVFSRKEGSRIIKPDGFKIFENVRIVRDLAVAMSHVHRKNVCHRDLKPDNIITIKGSRGIVAKIIDFGICYPQGSPRRTRVGVAIGTPGYMAPEQIIPGEIDNRTDIYTLGLILFESYSGSSIFAGHEVLDAQYQLMRSKDFVAKRIEEEMIPSHVAPIIKKCLRFKVEERYPIMDQVVGALDLSLDQEDHYLIGRVSLLTQKKSQDDVVTIDDNTLDIAEEADDGFEDEESTDVVDVANLKKPSKRKKRSKLILALPLGLLLIGVSVLIFILLYSPKEKESETKAISSSNRNIPSGPMVRKVTTDAGDILQNAVKKCRTLISNLSLSPYQLTQCLQGRAWVFYSDDEYDKALELALKIEQKYWKKRKYRYRREVKWNLRLVFRLLGKLYRRKARMVRKYGSEWNALSRRAAHYEQMVKYLKKK